MAIKALHISAPVRHWRCTTQLNNIITQPSKYGVIV